LLITELKTQISGTTSGCEVL